MSPKGIRNNTLTIAMGTGRILIKEKNTRRHSALITALISVFLLSNYIKMLQQNEFQPSSPETDALGCHWCPECLRNVSSSLKLCSSFQTLSRYRKRNSLLSLNDWTRMHYPAPSSALFKAEYDAHTVICCLQGFLIFTESLKHMNPCRGIFTQTFLLPLQLQKDLSFLQYTVTLQRDWRGVHI